jgi:hypothetical protein
MRSLFADTFYWIVLLNRREVWYSRVVALSRTLGTRRLLTTEWVLAEFLAFYSAGGAVTRQRAAAKTRQILQDPQIDVLPPSQATLLDGLALYESRLDHGSPYQRSPFHARRLPHPVRVTCRRGPCTVACEMLLHVTAYAAIPANQERHSAAR